MIRQLLGVASPDGSRGRLSVLILHRVLDQHDPLFPGEIDAARFDSICRWVAGWFTVLPLDEAVRRLGEGSLPPRALAISFDDGYADNHRVALPILARHGLCATFFVATGFLDGGRMWNDTLVEAIRNTTVERLHLDDLLGAEHAVHSLGTLGERQRAIGFIIRAAMYLGPGRREAVVQAIAARCSAPLRHDLMMTSRQVRALHEAGMQIGAHTVTHPILATLDDAAARREITGGKQFLETIIGARVPLFAYPSGKPGTDYSARTVELVRDAGFDAAFSTAPGAARRGTDRWQIPRFTPWDRLRWRFGARMMKNMWATRREVSVGTTSTG